MMLWDRYNYLHTGRRYTRREENGLTPYGVLLDYLERFRISIENREISKKSPEWRSVVEANGQNFSDWHDQHTTVMIKNMSCMHASLGTWMWNAMLKDLRLAMGMATNTRLGGSEKCVLKILCNDTMNFIFEELIKSISYSEKYFMVS